MLPQDFITLVKPNFADEWGNFEAALTEKPSLSVRLNDKICEPIPVSSQVSWCPSGFYLDERPNFTLDPLFHAGAYYVQEASSMFLYQAVNQFIDKNAIVLDLCAAPGGKSTLLAQYLSQGLLVANEFIRQRAQILSENLQKWGSPNVIVTNNSPADFSDFSGIFDSVLVDAPCSGEGMFRKDETAVADWSLANVQHCVERQREILQHAWVCLQENGVLIYSTCTYNSLENEENVRWICENFDAEILRISIEKEWNITETAEGYHFYPHKTRGEGLFMAALRKKSAENPAKFRYKNVCKNFANSPFANYLKNADDFALFEHRQLFYAFQKSYAELLQACLNRLSVLHFGVALAEQKGKDFVPQASLALSKMLNLEAFNSVNVDLETALRFLHCEAISLPDAPKGFLLILYQNLPIGWVKNVGNRCNNLYPTAWRIRMNLK